MDHAKTVHVTLRQMALANQTTILFPRSLQLNVLKLYVVLALRLWFDAMGGVVNIITKVKRSKNQMEWCCYFRGHFTSRVQNLVINAPLMRMQQVQLFQIYWVSN